MPVRGNDANILFWCLVAAYGIMLIIAVIQFIRIMYYTSAKNRISSQTILYIFVILSFLARTICYAILPTKVDSDHLSQILNTFPAMMSFSAFMFIIAFWGDLYYRSRGKIPRFTTVFIVLNIIYYVFGLTLFVVYACVASDVVYYVIMIMGACVSIVLGVGGAIFGSLSYCLLRDFPVVAGSIKRLAKKVGVVAVICVTCFSLRGIALMVYAALQGYYSEILDSDVFYVSFTATYSFIGELLPMGLLLYFMGSVPPRADPLERPFAGSSEHPTPDMYTPESDSYQTTSYQQSEPVPVVAVNTV
eukprot:TRINITY_DN7558_c0_g2_i1.p1 TRINITY_DN7558_c0_g2~~TRINITY_DN7558_c0_g2_i1.p1  ORF type:complete len:304 (-),score=38.26 TRINITY_DN7558_c0_g2_i1:66-977(-)